MEKTMKKRLIYLCLVLALIAITACRDMESKEGLSPESMEESFQKQIKVVALEELTPENLLLKRNLELTPETLQVDIEMADRSLEILEEALEFKEINPEERFRARTVYKKILQERDSLLNVKKVLEKKKSEAECVK